jgi:hypothetical protein
MTAIRVEPLTNFDVLKAVYEALKAKHSPQVLTLTIFNEVADDSDWHRTRTGNMLYEEECIFCIEDKTWLIAFSDKPTGYPANGYSCDLIAIPLEIQGMSEAEVAKEVKEKIEGPAQYFRYSLVTGLSDGNFALSEASRYFSKMSKKVVAAVKTHRVSKTEYERNLYHLDLRRVASSTARYKPEIVDELVTAIEEVLSLKK